MGNKILMRTDAVHERVRRTPGLVGTFSKFGSLSGVVPSLDGGLGFDSEAQIWPPWAQVDG